ncbi:hypothetical protein QWZ08_00420 [Ferruginibacter paludis]|uniref:hypothetical protein n=1 Tax=Ferruginibacter paludis TaxID=1310417 RepID=UPI0025B585BE|nr:hypothetical protein [Ferruginibacter paludis]MDN3654065.1 hypothetical protein [Ferruginibacter paludis]
MKITRGEYCRFSLQGRVQLLCCCGRYVCSAAIENKYLIVYKLPDFYVEVLTDLHNHTIVHARPVLSLQLIAFYKKISF